MSGFVYLWYDRKYKKFLQKNINEKYQKPKDVNYQPKT